MKKDTATTAQERLEKYQERANAPAEKPASKGGGKDSVIVPYIHENRDQTADGAGAIREGNGSNKSNNTSETPIEKFESVKGCHSDGSGGKEGVVKDPDRNGFHESRCDMDSTDHHTGLIRVRAHDPIRHEDYSPAGGFGGSVGTMVWESSNRAYVNQGALEQESRSSHDAQSGIVPHEFNAPALSLPDAPALSLPDTSLAKTRAGKRRLGPDTSSSVSSIPHTHTNAHRSAHTNASTNANPYAKEYPNTAVNSNEGNSSGYSTRHHPISSEMGGEGSSSSGHNTKSKAPRKKSSASKKNKDGFPALPPTNHPYYGILHLARTFVKTVPEGRDWHRKHPDAGEDALEKALNAPIYGPQGREARTNWAIQVYRRRVGHLRMTVWRGTITRLIKRYMQVFRRGKVWQYM